jgi:hypothetical protein
VPFKHLREADWSQIAAFNDALDLRRRVPLEEATQLLQSIAACDKTARP